MKKLLLFIGIVCSTTYSLWGQTLKINASVSKLFPSFCDSNSTQFLRFNVTYEGPTISGNENVQISYQIDGSTHTMSNIAGFISPTSGDTIGVADTVTITPANGFSNNELEDIVVIWPTGSGSIAITGDSITDSTYIEPAGDTIGGIASLSNGTFNIVLYPNPAENILYLNYNESKINLEQVRIYDLLGQTVLTKTSSFNTIDIGGLPSGSYFMEAVATDKSRYVLQFVKSQ